MKVLIGIVGKKQSGKDTVGNIIYTLAPHGYTPIRLAFADALKEELATALGTTVEVLNANKHTTEVRKILQWWGTEYRREQNGKDYWINRLEEQFKKAPPNSLIYITDARYLNEAEWIKKQGGKILRIFRKSVDEIEDKHKSEQELNKIWWDYSIHNDSTFGRLGFDVKMFLRQLYEQLNLI